MKIDRSIFHPDFKAMPYWWEAAKPGTEHARDLPSATEIFVVGSGYAGLSAALELARNGRQVTVADARAFGEGASSRSGGGVSAGTNFGKGLAGGPGQDKRAVDQNRMLENLLGESMAAYEHLQRIIEREKIDCHFERHGRFIGAYCEAHLSGLRKKAEFLNRVLEIGASVVPPADQRGEIASDFYYGGMAVERAGKLHPSLLHKGLFEACHRAGVRLCAHTEVTRIDGVMGAFSVRTSRGNCSAEEVVIATNGYTGALTPQLGKRLVPISSQIIVTEELPEDLAREIIPKGRTISETARITCYYRLLPGNRRVMFGGRARFQDIPADMGAALLYRMMTDRMPQLAGAKITHSWSGFVAMTMDALAHMGRIDGLHYCMGCNGSGVAMMTYLGHQTARKILRGGRAESAYDELSFPEVPVPFYRGRPWFLPLIGGYYRYLDLRDRNA